MSSAAETAAYLGMRHGGTGAELVMDLGLALCVSMGMLSLLMLLLLLMLQSL